MNIIMTTTMMIMTTTITSTNMKISLIRAAMGSLLLGGFLHSSFAQIIEQDSAQDFVQDLGSSVVQTEGPTHAILDGLREDDDLKKDALERKLSTTIAETIKNEPDVAIRSMGPAAARPVIKGLSGSHVEITEDGAFCGDMSATSPDHAVASEVLTAHRLRVLRGPHILAHSFSAAGGVVQVERRDIPFDDTLFHGYVAGYSESAQSGYATAVGANASVAGVSLKGELSGRRMGDMETPDGTLKNTDIENGSGAVGAAYALGRFRFGASYRWFNSDYGIPGGFIGGHPNGVDIEMWKRDLTLRGLYLPANSSIDTLSLTFRSNQYHHKEYEGSAVGAEFAVNQRILLIEKTMANLGPLFGLKLGAELETRWIEMGGYVFTPPTQSYGAATFASVTTSGWRGLEITAAARMGGAFFRPHESVVADMEAIEDRNFALWAFDVEFSQRVGVGKFLTLDVFRTTRAPTIEELYNQGPHLAAYTYERGNHKLDAESGYGGELEYRAYGEYLNVRTSAYGTWFQNHLAPRATGDTNWSQLLPIYEVRGDEALLYGASASVETVAEQGFRAATSASYVRGMYRNTHWSDMPQIPPFKFHGELGYLWEHVRTGAHTDFALAQHKVDKYEERTPGYITFGASLEFYWELALAHYSLVFRTDNIFDADVRNHLSRLKSVMPEKGRNFSALAKIEW
ncbi:TonB-dependent receptor domain-containing protein [Fibrobacter sp. UWT2]|uniref:TonB-dependent receptor domain-containing protein n=1 Tax=Fibrobacter sp. UWT2 TaxID=1896224 RepID=UPI0021006E85|nr:TonB-dependent receptor [Fibrobacter sp. UWT2]